MDFVFAKIEGTAGWYYNKSPGFLTVDTYSILEEFSTQNLRTQEQKGNKRRHKEEPEIEAEDVFLDTAATRLSFNIQLQNIGGTSVTSLDASRYLFLDKGPFKRTCTQRYPE